MNIDRQTSTLGTFAIGDGASIEVTQTHCIDRAANDGGESLCHYEYDIYRYSDGKDALVARSYSSHPSEAHFLRLESSGESRPLSSTDLEAPLIKAAIRHLRSIGKVELYWLDFQNTETGYSPVSYEA